MLSNKIVADPTTLGNENRSHIGRRGIYNEPRPMNADGGVSGTNRAGDLPPGILGPNGMTRDAHAGGRHSALQNLGTRPGEKSRERYAEEVRRRLHDPARDVRYK